MKNLCNEDKLILIRSLCHEHKITPLEISKGTGITLNAAKDVSGTKNYNPQARTMDLVIQYIENRLSLNKGRRDIINALRAELAARDVVIAMQEEKIRWIQNSCC